MFCFQDLMENFANKVIDFKDLSQSCFLSQRRSLTDQEPPDNNVEFASSVFDSVSIVLCVNKA